MVTRSGRKRERGTRRHRLAAWAAGVLAAALTCAAAASGTAAARAGTAGAGLLTASGSQAPVVACPTTYGISGQRPPSRFPATMTLPGANAGRLGYYSDQARSVQPVLGPLGWACSAGVGADGGTSITVFPPGTSAPQHEEIYAVDDGACQGCIAGTACPLVPDAESDLGYPPGTFPACLVPRPSQETVSFLAGSPAAGSSGSDVVEFTDPPGVRGDGSGGPYTARGLLLFSWGSSGNRASEVTCTLPAADAGVCSAVLSAFRDENWPDGLAVPTSSAGTPDCKEAADVSLEAEIDETSTKEIKISGRAIDLTAGLSGNVTAAFVPGQVTVCDAGLQPKLDTPGGFDNGELGLSTATKGPFVYDSSVAAWTQAPGAPPGQKLATDFTGAQFKTSIRPVLSATFSASGPSVGLDIASVTATAPTQVVTLVSSGQAVLQAGLGPSVEFSVSIDKSSAETQVEDEEAGELSSADATTEVGDELAGDAVGAIAVEAYDFYGIQIPVSYQRAVAAQLEPQFTSALDDDPDLGVGGLGLFDAVPADAAAGSASEIGAELGATEVGVEGDALLILLAF